MAVTARPTDARAAVVHVRLRLQEAGVEEAHLEADVLVRHVLGLERADLLARPETPLAPAQSAALEGLMARRERREPLAYVLGRREFHGLDFRVTPAVMVPRPETETLVEEALAWARSRPAPVTVADVGTGSGCIVVTLAARLPDVRFLATDVSPAALAVAEENAHRHGVAGRVRLLSGHLLQPLPGPVDLVVANLPYVPSGRLDSLQPEVRDHEPRGALDGGPDGTDLLRPLLRQAGSYLRPGGALMLEIDEEQGPALAEAARSAFPAATVSVLPDLSGRDRVLVVQT